VGLQHIENIHIPLSVEGYWNMNYSMFCWSWCFLPSVIKILLYAGMVHIFSQLANFHAC
jgi:hypothetical protein